MNAPGIDPDPLGKPAAGDPAITPVASRRAIPPGARESSWTAPDGHVLRRIDWSGGDAHRGALLFLPGRGDAYEKWLETLDHWAGRGWAVTSLDWRGQALSGRLGRDAATGHIDDFAEWGADLAAFWGPWSAQRAGPHVLVAHSMGGHVALRAAAEHALVPAPEALVLSAPMLGLLPERIATPLLHAVARLLAALGDRRRPAWGASEKPSLVPEARTLLLTHDAARYEDEAFWRELRPGLAMGPASWGWIERALASIRLLERPGMLEGLEIPVQLLGTSADRLVSWRAIERSAARLPAGELVGFGSECRHEILRECDAVRDRALGAIDAFLARVAPARG